MAEYAPGTERVNVTASPNLQTVQARNDPNGSVNQLVNALGIAQPGIDKFAAQVAHDDTVSGTAYANSLTVEELGKKIKSGELLPSQSPAYVATVQHIYGQNSMEQQQRDTLSKISRGELTFPDNASLDAHLVKQRNEALVGQSKYTIAGFDKGWDIFGKQALSANARVNDAAFVARGTQEGIDHLLGAVASVSGKDFTGTPDEAATKIMNQYGMLRVTEVLGLPAQQKEVLGAVLSEVAGSGNRALLAALLKQSTVDGPTLTSIIGGERSRHLVNAAHAADDVNQRQRVDVELRPFLDAAVAGDLSGSRRQGFEAWVTGNEAWVTTATRQSVLNAQRMAEDHLARANDKAEIARRMAQSLADAQQQVRTAVASGDVAFLPPITVLHHDGTPKPFNAAEYAATVIPEVVEKNKLGLPQQMQLWSTNNVQNPQWRGIIGAGASNLASVGWASDGKTVGQLNDQGKAALKLYSDLHQVNPSAAEQYAGKDSKMLGDILFMQRKGGLPDVSAAASLVNQAHRSGIQPGDYAVKVKEVDAAVRDLTDSHFFSLTNQSTVQWVKSLFGGNGDLNFTQVAADIRRRAELLVLSGQVPDAKAAVKSSLEYLASPAVTSKVNGTLYYNQDLPTVPKGENQGEWLEKFIAAGPAEIAKQQGMGDGSRTRLEPNAQGGFTAWVGGVPLQDSRGDKVVYQKADIETWVHHSSQNEMFARGANRNVESFSDRLLGGFTQKGLLQAYPDISPGVISFHGQPVSVKELISTSNYERLKSEDLAAGTAEEIINSTLNARKKKK